MSKQKVTFWLQPHLAKVLRDRAALSGQTLSETAAEFVAKALEAQAQEAEAGVLMPAVRDTIRREFGAVYRQLETLLARSALEGGTGRRLILQLLGHHLGQTAAQEFNSRAWGQAVENLKRPLEGLRSALEVSGGDGGQG